MKKFQHTSFQRKSMFGQHFFFQRLDLTKGRSEKLFLRFYIESNCFGIFNSSQRSVFLGRIGNLLLHQKQREKSLCSKTISKGCKGKIYILTVDIFRNFWGEIYLAQKNPFERNCESDQSLWLSFEIRSPNEIAKTLLWRVAAVEISVARNWLLLIPEYFTKIKILKYTFQNVFIQKDMFVRHAKSSPHMLLFVEISGI